MVQVTNFLLRWLFLCRLVDDRAEVQTWPYRRPGYYEHPPQQHQQSNPHQQPRQQHLTHQHPPLHDQHNAHQTYHMDENDAKMDIPTYRESVIRSLTSYPPGSFERLQRLEELRLQTVREFAERLVHADEVIRWSALGGQQQKTDSASAAIDVDGAAEKPIIYDDGMQYIDKTIQDDFQNFIQQQHASHGITHHGMRQSNLWNRWQFLRGHKGDEAEHGISTDEETNRLVESESHNPLKSLTPEQTEVTIAAAHKLLAEAREFLPQLVSTVLHSPPSLLPENVSPDPISSLRSLLIHRCQTNPSLGIALCWLLEAEVGRKWKALFEHRQQTGKRLILIVQADIAAAIATIGAEKASAFNLLQDAEMATAFGMERRYEDVMGHNGHQGYHHPQQQQLFSDSSSAAASYRPPPRSISDLRCRHFGDSMHFVDQLTQISLDLRHVPPVHRQSHLQQRLTELNRRLCRRMVTRGRISIDVEDLMDSHYGPASVPQWSEENVREDMIRHSVHFPMEPQCVCWPGGLPSTSNMQSAPSNDNSVISDFENPEKRNGVVRALRILPNNCRVLASAQRCPFLVRMEVVETGLDANDARLYALDVPGGVGVTIQEALGSIRSHGDSVLSDQGVMTDCGFAPCEIPPELMMERQHRPSQQLNYAAPPRQDNEVRNDFEAPRNGDDASGLYSNVLPPPYSGTATSENRAVLSRGGYQGGDESYDIPHDTFDMVREHYYDDLHHTLRQQRENQFYSPNQSMVPTSVSNQLSTGSDLLDRVFGRPWNEECENIRQQSPYRNVKGWKLASFIIKAGEDIRKEALVMQIMSKLWTWFQEEIPPHLRPFLRPYTIMCTGGDAGIVECLPDVKSVNEVKKETDGYTTLLNFFERAYGPSAQPPSRPDYHRQQMTSSAHGTVSIDKARDNFLRSLVGYSVVCYILQIKDRHNANILLDRDGHIMHIDFGFVLGETPKMGKVPLFSERAPFKLSADFWEVIGGWRSFKRFCEMFESAYAVAAAHSDEICSLIEAAIMNVSRNTDLARATANGVRGRIQMKADPKEQKLHIMNIVNDAITSWGTSTYDWLQRSMHGYQ